MLLFAALGYQYISSTSEQQAKEILDRQLNQVEKNLEDWNLKMRLVYERLYQNTSFSDVFQNAVNPSNAERYLYFDQFRFAFMQILPADSEVLLMDDKDNLYFINDLHFKFAGDLTLSPLLDDIFNRDAAMIFLPESVAENLFSSRKPL